MKLKIEIQSQEQADSGHKVFAESVSRLEKIKQGTLTNMACLENGQFQARPV
jgi:hypothetical protein